MNVKQTAVARAITLLDAAGAKYKIIDEDGVEFGELQVKPTPKRGPIINKGLADYARNTLQHIVPGDVVFIPSNGYPLVRVQAAACEIGKRMWGQKSVITHKKDDGVEVLRVQ